MSSSTSSNAAATIKTCVIDAVVVMKIIKHCRENLPELVSGQLLGLDEGDELRITNSFPLPTQEEDDGGDYQVEMMRCLREVNIDSNTIGWYQSTFLGSYLTEAMIDSQYQYQSQIKNSVVLIYDPIKTNQGTVSLQVFRLTPAFMDVYASGVYTKEAFERKQLTFNNIFEEIPVQFRANLLSTVLLKQIDGASEVDTANHVLSLQTESFVEKNLELLIESVDELGVEQSKMAKHAHHVARQKAMVAQWIARRRAENNARRARGEKPLPDSRDAARQDLGLKPATEPSRLESLLLTRQLASYCDALTTETGASYAKLHTVDALRRTLPPQRAAAAGAVPAAEKSEK